MLLQLCILERLSNDLLKYMHESTTTTTTNNNNTTTSAAADYNNCCFRTCDDRQYTMDRRLLMIRCPALLHCVANEVYYTLFVLLFLVAL